MLFSLSSIYFFSFSIWKSFALSLLTFTCTFSLFFCFFFKHGQFFFLSINHFLAIFLSCFSLFSCCHVLLEGHQSAPTFFQVSVLDFASLVLFFLLLRRGHLPVFPDFQVLPIFGAVLGWYCGLSQLFLYM